MQASQFMSFSPSPQAVEMDLRPQFETASAPLKCVTCCRKQSVEDCGCELWLCAGCMRRGDLAHDHPINLALRPPLSGHAAPSQPAAAAASSSSSLGQSSSHSKAQVTLEQHFETLLAETRRAGSAFGAASPGMPPLSADDAVAAIRRAFQSTQHEEPPSSLLALIRAGKLRKPAYALPRILADHVSDAPMLATTLNSGLSAPSRAGTDLAPPPLKSSAAFSSALFSTILPALAANPRAVVEWCTLGTTVLRLEAARGWPVASRYIDSVLNDSLTTGSSFGVFNYLAMTDIILSSPASGNPGGATPRAAPAASSATAPAGGRARPPQDTVLGVCHDFNKGVCTRAVCKWTHACGRCGVVGHVTSGCSQAAAAPYAGSVRSAATRRAPAAAAAAAPAVASSQA